MTYTIDVCVYLTHCIFYATMICHCMSLEFFPMEFLMIVLFCFWIPHNLELLNMIISLHFYFHRKMWVNCLDSQLPLRTIIIFFVFLKCFFHGFLKLKVCLIQSNWRSNSHVGVYKGPFSEPQLRYGAGFMCLKIKIVLAPKLQYIEWSNINVSRTVMKSYYSSKPHLDPQ